MVQLKVTGMQTLEVMRLNGCDEEVPIALTRGKQSERDPLYLSLVEGEIGLLELGMRASDGLLVSVTPVNVARDSVVLIGRKYAATPLTRSATTEGHSAPVVDVSYWHPLSEFGDRFITENANVRYTCYLDAIAIEWAPDHLAAQESWDDGQVTWLLASGGYLRGLIIRNVSSSKLAMFKASTV